MTPWTDFLRQEIKVGSEIIYAGRRGSSMWFRRAKVVGLDDTYCSIEWQPKYMFERGKSKISRVAFVIVIDKIIQDT